MSNKRHPKYRPILKKVRQVFAALREKGIAALENFW